MATFSSPDNDFCLPCDPSEETSNSLPEFYNPPPKPLNGNRVMSSVGGGHDVVSAAASATLPPLPNEPQHLPSAKSIAKPRKSPEKKPRSRFPIQSQIEHYNPKKAALLTGEQKAPPEDTKPKSRASKTLKTLNHIKQTMSSAPPQLLSNQSIINPQITAPETATTNGGDTPMASTSPINTKSAEEAFITLPSMAAPMTFTDDPVQPEVYTTFPSVGKRKKRPRDDEKSKRDGDEKKKKRGRRGQSLEGKLQRSDSNKSDSKENVISYPPIVRSIPCTSPTKKSHVIANDDNPQRLTNPLLSLPHYPPGDPPLEEIPTGGELWKVTDLIFECGDTWPLGWMGRVLGFDLPENGDGVGFGEGLDVDKLKKLGEELEVPGRGGFVNQVWKRNHNNYNNSSQASHVSKGAIDDAVLSQKDPLYTNILQTYRGYNEDFRDVGKGYAGHLSPLVLEFAVERGVVKKDEVRFRMAGVEDVEVLSSLEKKCQNKCQPKQDILTTLKTPGTYIILAESNQKPLAYVQYRFCWYKVEEKKLGPNQMTSYGVKSRAGEAVDKISELVFFIDNVIHDDVGEGGGVAGESTAQMSQSNTEMISQSNTEATKAVETDNSSCQLNNNANGDGDVAAELAAQISQSSAESNSQSNAAAKADETEHPSSPLNNNADGDGGDVATDSAAEISQSNTATKADETEHSSGQLDTNAADTANTDKSINQSSNPITSPDMETTRVLLMSLALIHAWSHNIWYGMMESPNSLVPFYSKYFRMVPVGKQGAGDDPNKPVPLVCDLKKCSFRYAIHLREESLKSDEQSQTLAAAKTGHNQSQTLAAAKTVNQRMLVHLPNPMDAIKSMHKPSADSEMLFSNAKNMSQAKQIQIRMSTAQQHEIAPEILSVTTAEGQETTTKVDFSSLDDVPTNWDIFKLFSTKIAHESDATCNNDFLLAELTKKQNELKILESSVENTSRLLLSKAYDNALDYHIGDRKAKAEREKQVLKDFEAVKQRLHEADLAWQAQLEQDMDAVCDVCWDGEVTPENQIIFCDSCNVAIHQGCYGIDKVPSGNYFCHPCIHHGKNNEFLAAERREGPRSAPTRKPIICELCPRRQGAFVQTETKPDSLRKPRWVHVGCAKWFGLHYLDIEKKDMIETVLPIKEYFGSLGSSCDLCKSNIGGLHQCRVDGCKKFLHLTCARCIGTCSVQHGENCEGLYPLDAIPFPPWTLACLEHSEVDPELVRKNSITADQLKAIAKSYPPEPVPPKPFTKMNNKERKEYWQDSDNLEAFYKKVTSIKSSAFCAVCSGSDCDEQCEQCGIYFHSSCVGTSGRCNGCDYTANHAGSADYKKPKCKMCNEKQGPLLRTFAQPMSMKKWKGNKSSMSQFNKSLFGPNNFCHVLCGFWNPGCRPMEGKDDDTVLNTTEIVLSKGFGFINDKHRCIVCGHLMGAKVDCSDENCTGKKMHVTCARAAGFEVNHMDDLGFILKCFHHSENANNLRARLEDMLEVEIGRSPNKTFDKVFTPMSWEHAASLYHSAVSVLRVLGWAWRWAEWWVAEGDNWEPLLEDGQVEAEMTDEELKIIRSTPESRCEDARRCRLAAFGAALRNRDYDKVDGDDQQPLERALVAVLSIPSLVGPLKRTEINFFALWLGLVYRLKSPLLGFGDDKIPVAEKDFCLHIADGSPKYELGNRPLPGKAEPENKSVFEPKVEEVDDFLQTRPKNIKRHEKNQEKEMENN